MGFRSSFRSSKARCPGLALGYRGEKRANKREGLCIFPVEATRLMLLKTWS